MKKEKMAYVTVRVDVGIRDRLEQLAEADDRTLSNYLRIVIAEHVNQSSESQQAAA